MEAPRDITPIHSGGAIEDSRLFRSWWLRGGVCLSASQAASGRLSRSPDFELSEWMRDLHFTGVELQIVAIRCAYPSSAQCTFQVSSVFDSSGARILLVQAEPVLAELTSFRLELLGYRIALVGSGGEAISSIQESLPDLAIVDTHLPDTDGIEWIARVRAEYGADRLPIIIFSLDPSLETVERAFHAGAQDYLITPFDPTVMEEKIEMALASRMTRRR